MVVPYEFRALERGRRVVAAVVAPAHKYVPTTIRRTSAAFTQSRWRNVKSAGTSETTHGFRIERQLEICRKAPPLAAAGKVVSALTRRVTTIAVPGLRAARHAGAASAAAIAGERDRDGKRRARPALRGKRGRTGIGNLPGGAARCHFRVVAGVPDFVGEQVDTVLRVVGKPARPFEIATIATGAGEHHRDHAEHEHRKRERNQHFNERESLMPLVRTAFATARTRSRAELPHVRLRAQRRDLHDGERTLCGFLRGRNAFSPQALSGAPVGITPCHAIATMYMLDNGCHFGDARTGRDGSAYHPRPVPGVRAQQAVPKFALIARHDGQPRPCNPPPRPVLAVVTDVQQRLLAIGIDAFDHFLRDHDRLCTLEASSSSSEALRDYARQPKHPEGKDHQRDENFDQREAGSLRNAEMRRLHMQLLRPVVASRLDRWSRNATRRRSRPRCR